MGSQVYGVNYKLKRSWINLFALCKHTKFGKNLNLSTLQNHKLQAWGTRTKNKKLNATLTAVTRKFR